MQVPSHAALCTVIHAFKVLFKVFPGDGCICVSICRHAPTVSCILMLGLQTCKAAVANVPKTYFQGLSLMGFKFSIPDLQPQTDVNTGRMISAFAPIIDKVSGGWGTASMDGTVSTVVNQRKQMDAFQRQTVALISVHAASCFVQRLCKFSVHFAWLIRLAGWAFQAI